MLRKTLDSFNFGFAGFLSAISGLIICLLILMRDGFHLRLLNADRTSPFLVDKKRTAVFYRFFSRLYDSVNAYFYTDNMRNEIAKLAGIEKCASVLDVGCGTGYTTESILRRLGEGQVTGIDLTRQQLQKAKRKLKAKGKIVGLSRGDVENLPFRDEVFDRVVSVGAIEYFSDPEKALKEMARVVKTEGRVVVGGPEYEWFKKVGLNHILCTPTVNEFQELFRKARLKSVKPISTGVNTFFGTDRYVAVVVGTK